MLFKLVCCLAFTALAFVAAAPKTKKADLQLLDDDEQVDLYENGVNERISALYVKDGESGQLRFLSGSSGGTNSNSALNQFITSKQDLLEQLRPSSTGTGTGSLSGTGTGTTNSVNPVIVNLSGSSSSTTGSNSALNAAINASPIADLLPQIVAGAVLNRNRGTTNRRRVNNRRRGGNRNRISNRNGNRKRRPGPVYVIRPNRG